MAFRNELDKYWGRKPAPDKKQAPAQASGPQRIPANALNELAAQAKALDEDWVQRSLLALNVVDSPGLAKALLVGLRIRAFIETIDPYPFDIPSEEDFV